MEFFNNLFSKPDELSAIRKAFKGYFGGQVELPKDIQPQSLDNYSQQSGWSYSYILIADAQGLPQLDFTAEHRMTNTRHVSIAHDGTLTHLNSYQEGYSYDDNIPGDEARSQKECYEYNRKISAMLIAKGLLSADDVDDEDDNENPEE